MIAGLPGTGIGGLFYLLLTAFMPLRHAASALNRRARGAHGRVVVRCVLLAAGIVATIWAQAWAMRTAILALAPSAALDGTLRGLAGASTATYVRVAAFASLASLSAVVLAVHVLRFVVRRPPVPAPPAALPSGHGLEAEAEGALARLRRAG
jgi:hypothetical protein